MSILLKVFSENPLGHLGRQARRNRLIRGIHAVIYGAVLVISPIGHAMFADEISDTTHIESQSFHQTRAHNEYLCQVCRLVELAGETSTYVAWSLEGLVEVYSDIGSTARPFTLRNHFPTTSRAPPQT